MIQCHDECLDLLDRLGHQSRVWWEEFQELSMRLREDGNDSASLQVLFNDVYKLADQLDTLELRVFEPLNTFVHGLRMKDGRSLVVFRDIVKLRQRVRSLHGLGLIIHQDAFNFESLLTE